MGSIIGDVMRGGNGGRNPLDVQQCAREAGATRVRRQQTRGAATRVLQLAKPHGLAGSFRCLS